MNLEAINTSTISETMPKMADKLIPRDAFLEMFKETLSTKKVLCVEGADGIGVSTTLAMFAKRYVDNCISFFFDRFSNPLTDLMRFENSLARQLHFIGTGKVPEVDDNYSFKSVLIKANKKYRNKGALLYIVIDELDVLSNINKDSFRQIIQSLAESSYTRFLVSGDHEKIKSLFPLISDVQSAKLINFSQLELRSFLPDVLSGITEEQSLLIHKMSKGNAEIMNYLIFKCHINGSLNIIDNLYENYERDFYLDDWNYICGSSHKDTEIIWALLTYANIPLTPSIISDIVGSPIDQVKDLLMYCIRYLSIEENYYSIKIRGFRKYLYKLLLPRKNDIENLLIVFFEKNNENGYNVEESYSNLPELYKNQNRNESLVSYLTSDNVQNFLDEQQSQAAVNIQCDYGFNASKESINYIDSAFRFAVERSASREIERNELIDSEIEALLSVGKEEEAYSLTQDIFLKEERLKALLIILRNSDHLSETIKNEIHQQASLLCDNIVFEHIPNKAIELAKLMLPVDFVTALSIIDKVAKITKDKSQMDEIYTMASLAYNEEVGSNIDEQSKQDIFATRITDDGIRKMASAMKNIMSDINAEQLLIEIKKLPSDRIRLFFLQFWIPENRNKEHISDVVFYAINLVIQVSDSVTPKVSLIKEYCKALDKMESENVLDVISRIDAITDIIKYPSIDYVKLQLLLIRALSKMDKKKACDRLQTLYLEIDDYEDKCIAIQAKSLLLKSYNKLGEKKDVETWLSMTGNMLKEDIINDIKKQLKLSAYHMKVIEGPIRSLVCAYPSFVDEVIPLLNTEERRSKAYLLALIEYVSQMDIDKIDWVFFNKLYGLVVYDPMELSIPMRIVIKKIAKTGKNDGILKIVKGLYPKLEKIEVDTEKCFALATIYVWLKNNYVDDKYAVDLIKPMLDKTWQAIDLSSIKAEVGYIVAQILSKIPMKVEANDYISKAKNVKEESLRPTDSFDKAYDVSISLYVHSLGLLIRAGLCTDDDLAKLQNILDYDTSISSPMILWSRIALEYYNLGNNSKFNEIVNSHLQVSLDNLSVYFQKKILYNIAPALFLSGANYFLDRISQFDNNFKNSCLDAILDFIVNKYPYSDEYENQKIERQPELSYIDCENILQLVDFSEDECFIFSAISTLCDAIKNNSNKRILSKEQISFIIAKLEDLIRQKLPTRTGIQHNGYRIACDAMLNSCRTKGQKDWNSYKAEIETIDNVADKSFLFTHLSRYIKKKDLQGDFLDKALELTKGITGGFDRMNRLDMCLSEAFESNSFKARKIAETAIQLLIADKNGSYQDCQKLIDIINDNDPELADKCLELVDKDPARNQYRKRIKNHLDSNKKIDSAKNDLDKISSLSIEERSKFFSMQLDSVIRKKNAYRDVNKTSIVITTIYESPISETKSAILYFMENVYWKHKANDLHEKLLININQSLYGNLNMVLSVASGTKQKMLRVHRIMNGNKINNEGGLVLTGQNKKGINILLSWLSNNEGSVLRIIDPYFHPEDLGIIKSFMDLRNDLTITILTHLDNNDSIDDFQISWNKISSELTGSIKIITVCYTEMPQKCPIHDRWWILYNPEEDQFVGKRLASIGGLGNKDSEISDIKEDDIDDINNQIWTKYVINQVQKKNGSRVSYSKINIK